MTLCPIARIGGCRAQGSLLEILRAIPHRRRAKGKKFDAATILLHAILVMVGGASSDRQMHKFIRAYLRRLNAAFGLRLRYAPSHVGLRGILQSVDPVAQDAAFRAHAAAVPPQATADGRSRSPSTARSCAAASTLSATARPTICCRRRRDRNCQDFRVRVAG